MGAIKFRAAFFVALGLYMTGIGAAPAPTQQIKDPRSIAASDSGNLPLLARRNTGTVVAAQQPPLPPPNGGHKKVGQGHYVEQSGTVKPGRMSNPTSSVEREHKMVEYHDSFSRAVQTVDARNKHKKDASWHQQNAQLRHDNRDIEVNARYRARQNSDRHKGDNGKHKKKKQG